LGAERHGDSKVPYPKAELNNPAGVEPKPLNPLTSLHVPPYLLAPPRPLIFPTREINIHLNINAASLLCDVVGSL